MFSEEGCLEKLKFIISEYADDENIKNMSLDELRTSYTEISENMYSISASNCLKYKSMLWNIDNLKPEIQLKFKTEIFNAWHSVHITSAKTDPKQDHPKNKKQESAPIVKAPKKPEINEKEKEQASLISGQQSIDSEEQKRMASSEETDLSLDMGPVEKHPPITVPKAEVQKYENDWFDKFLDFFAAVVGGVSRTFGLSFFIADQTERLKR